MRRSIDAKYGRKGMRLLMQVITVCLMLTLAGMFPGAYPAMAAPSGTGVGSVAELTAAINAGTSEIYLTSDLKIPGYVSFNNGKNMRLDLNGHTITLNSASTSRSCIMIKENSGLTICDTSSGQTGTITGAYRPAAAGDGADESTHVTETSSTTDNQAKTSPRTGDGSCMERILLLMAAALLMISGAGVSLCKRGKRG